MPNIFFIILQNNLQNYKVFKTQKSPLYKLFLQRAKAANIFPQKIERKNPNANPTDGNPMKVLECSTSEIPTEKMEILYLYQN